MRRKHSMLILAEKELGERHGKTAHGVLRYIPEQVAAVIDRRYAEKTVEEIIGYGGAIPIVASVDEGMVYKPDSLLIGLANTGGVLPKKWRNAILEAIRNNLNIINGLHTFLSSDSEFQKAAKRYGVKLIDLRIPPLIQRCSEGRPLYNNAKVVLTVGTDGAIGKMTVMLEIFKEFRKIEPSSTCIATGQTGMVITGKGYAIDAIKSDFVGGVMEELLIKESKQYQYLFVEGQGSLLHQGFSAVTLGLMHGTLPDIMIMCLRLGKTHNELGVKIPPLHEFISLHEQLIGYFKQSKVVGIAVNSTGFSIEEAKKQILMIEKEFKLPADDCVRFGGKKLADSLLNYFNIH